MDAHVQRSLEGFRENFRHLAFDILHIPGSEGTFGGVIGHIAEKVTANEFVQKSHTGLASLGLQRCIREMSCKVDSIAVIRLIIRT